MRYAGNVESMGLGMIEGKRARKQPNRFNPAVDLHQGAFIRDVPKSSAKGQLIVWACWLKHNVTIKPN